MVETIEMTSNIDWLKDRLNGRGDPIVTDGGMGTELEKVGVTMHSKVWSGEARDVVYPLVPPARGACSIHALAGRSAHARARPVT